MESRNITLTLNKAKEWYKQGGELKEVALQAYTEVELTRNELPNTWEEFCENYPLENGYFKLDDCIIKFSTNNDRDINTLSSYKAAKAHLALMQLHQLRDCYRQGWVPDWNNSEEKFAIIFRRNNFTIESFAHISNFLSFPTKKLAKKFLTNFIDLLEQAKYLIY